ncbi:MAG: HDIG domain-containing metalloprotein [Phycisphaeraceae bacterium]
MPTPRSSRTARRREVRRYLPRPGRRVGPLGQPDFVAAGLWALLLAAVATLIAWPDSARLRYDPGAVITDAIVARVDFEAVNRTETERRRTDAMNRQPRVYVANEQFYEELRQHLDEELLALAQYNTVEELPRDYREGYAITPETLESLRRFAGGEVERSWDQRVRAFRRSLFDLALLEPEQYAIEQEDEIGVGGIVILHPDPLPGEATERDLYPRDIYPMDDTEALAEVIARKAVHFPIELRDSVTTLVLERLQPTYLYNSVAEELTAQRRAARYAREPAEIDPIRRGDPLVRPGTRLEDAHIELIEAEREAYQATLGRFERTMHHAALLGIMVLLSVGLWSYIVAFKPRVVRNPWRALAITLLVVICHGLAVWITLLHPRLPYITTIAPTVFTAIVLSIAYDRQFALTVGFIHTLLVVVSLDLGMGVAVVMLAGVSTAVALLEPVRTRSTIVLVGLASGGVMALATGMTGLFDRPLHLPGEQWRILVDMFHAALVGLFTGLFVQGILPGIEKVFKVTTAMTLRELNDASHPLLQRLAQEAPGTFQHSLRMADMAEAAADAIGADGLLCRVGAMYHDVGKLHKPEYFIENQTGGPSRHAKLSPAMSLLIIVGHVKDGIEMAREYRLPATIIHCIESHHGTTLVEYFYHAARKQRADEDEPAPSEFEFRYPGPKPQTKEAAIMLLCDSVEAAARSLAEPTPIRLEQIVQRMMSKRLMDGQFNECQVTLQELHRIEEAITKTLRAIYHGRVKYPTDQPERTAAPRPAAPQPRSAAS